MWLRPENNKKAKSHAFNKGRFAACDVMVESGVTYIHDESRKCTNCKKKLGREQ